MILLVTLLVKSLLVFALAGAVLLALRRASAAARHLVCLLTLAALLALPLFSVTLPGWRLRVLEPTPARSSLSPPETGRARVGTGLAPALGASPALSAPPDLKASPILGKPSAPEPLRPPVSGGPLRSNLLRSKEVGFLTLYLLGVLLASLRPLLGLWGIARLSRLCLDIQDPPTLAASAHCAETLHLRMPRLCRADVCVPMTWGWRHPVVLLPTESTDWPQDRLQSVLLHEMAHIKRRDWVSHRLADLVCALYWFHPLVWLTARRLRTEGELACDDLVLTSGIAASDYARHLLEIAGTLSRVPNQSQAAIAMAQTSKVEGRILMILDKTHVQRTLSRRVVVSAIVLGAGTLIPLAALRLTTHAQAISGVSAIPAMQFAPQLPEVVTSQTVRTTSVSAELLGITDENKPADKWWSASGAPLPKPPFVSIFPHPLTVTDATGERSLVFAFRLPQTAQNVTAMFEAPDCVVSSSSGGWPGKTQGQADFTEAMLNLETGGVRTLEAIYPISTLKASLRVGIASGAWKVTTKMTTAPLNHDSGARSTDFGTFIFSPMVETKNGIAVSVAVSQLKQDVRIVALDMQGKTLLPESIGDQSLGAIDQITAQFSIPLNQIKEVQVETRPFTWTEFKNVALQPVK
ncbi:MAG: M56 family metallopeptidase [Janthinobacterium lividum]